jgi:hypothetical protein
MTLRERRRSLRADPDEAVRKVGTSVPQQGKSVQACVIDGAGPI